MKTYFFKIVFVSLCFVLLITGQSNATIICFDCGDESSDFGTGASLQELFDGASIQVDDKLFTNWIGSNASYGDGVLADLSKIEVIGLDDLLFNTGLRFISNGEWYVADDRTSTDGGTVTTHIGYDVVVLDPLLTITDASLEMVIGQGNTSPGGVGIHETIWGSDNIGIGDPFVWMSVLFDQVDFSDKPQTTISTWTGLQISTGTPAGGVGDLEYYDARYSQTPVPEPTTMLLLGTGLVGVAGAARRKKKNLA